MIVQEFQLPEVNVEPLGDLMLGYLIERDKEEPFLDFKETLSIAKDAPFPKLAKDIFAFANYGGGFILIGFREKSKISGSVQSGLAEKRNYLPIGLPPDFHIDPADLQTKFNAYSNHPMEIQYREFTRTFDNSNKKFAAIYVPASPKVLKPIKTGYYRDEKWKTRTAFVASQVIIRRGTQSLPASEEEIAWVERRAEKEGYRLSVLSGRHDEIQETIYCNLFEVTKLPDLIWLANCKPIGQGMQPARGDSEEAVYIWWNNKVVTFDDLSSPDSSLSDLVDGTSVKSERLADWLSNEDKKKTVIYLLNKELRSLAERLRIAREPDRQKFYYKCEGDSRTESWTPRFRKSSTLTVAQRMWAQQLKRYIYWHVAVKANFQSWDGRIFLQLSPTLLLTEDGARAIWGTKEGSVITRLSYNRWNSIYFNSLLFWISRFVAGKENVTLANGKVLVSAEPVEAKVNVGILSDRPSAEILQEEPEIEFSEG